MIDTIVFECPQCGEKFHAVPNNWNEVDERIKNGKHITCECPVCGTMISMKPVNCVGCALNDALSKLEDND